MWVRHRASLACAAGLLLVGGLCSSSNAWRLEKQGDDDSAARPLLLITPRSDLDYTQLGKRVILVDHYFDRQDDHLQHFILGIPRQAEFADLGDLPLTYRVIDPGERNTAYFWIAGLDRESPRLRTMRARVLAARGAETSLLLALPADALPVDGGQRDLGLARSRRIDTEHEIRPEWISPQSRKRSLDRMRQRSSPGRRNTTIEAMVQGVDADACRRLMDELTGKTPITIGTESRTIHSRFATSDDMGPLTTWLAAELARDGLETEIDTFVSPVHSRALPQVVATLPGTDLKDELLLVTAHLDAVRNTVGANDNASGIVAMVAAARRLTGHRFRRTIQFVAFNDEEQGLIGSADLASRMAAQGRMVVGVLNLDMVAHDLDGDKQIQLQSNGTASSNLLSDQLAAAVQTYALGVAPVKVVDPEESSDYASFWRVGYPAINIGDEYFQCDGDCTDPPRRGIVPPAGDFSPCYHLPCDRTDDPGFRSELIVEVSRMVVAGVANLAELDASATNRDSK